MPTTSAPTSNWEIREDFERGSEGTAFASDHDIIQERAEFLSMPIHDVCVICALAEGVDSQQIEIVQNSHKFRGVCCEVRDLFAHTMT